MGKVIKIREVGELILKKQCDKVDIKNINEDIIDIITDMATMDMEAIIGNRVRCLRQNKIKMRPEQ